MSTAGVTTQTTSQTVQTYFDEQARAGRRLLPDPQTLRGLGAHRKYSRAASIMAEEEVNDVLDVGCNRGSIEALFAEQHSEKAARTCVEGVDISEDAVELARQLDLPNCQFQTYDGYELPFESESFDLVLLIEVLEHVIEKERLLREINRVLRPGGRLLLTTPNPGCWPLRIEAAMLHSLRRLLRKQTPAKDSYITHDDLAELIDRTAFHRDDERRMYAAPRLFLQFLGWSLIPPVPSRLLYWYQRGCLRLFDDKPFPLFFDRRFKWSLMALLQKPTVKGKATHS